MNIIDLFSGAGGLTFGFYYKLNKEKRFVENKRNHFIFANEFDKLAAEAFCSNFPKIKTMQNCDIKDLTNDKIKKLVGDKSIDLLIGGPPCQSFSTVGQRMFDDKAKLYEEYIRIISVAKPKMFLFENVKGLLSMQETIYSIDENGKVEYDYITNKHTKRIYKKPKVISKGKKVIELLESDFHRFGYSIQYQVLNAKNYGVPQSRERVIIIGIRNDLKDKIRWEFPQETHGKDLLPYITIKEAISDLPVVIEGENKESYSSIPKNDYQRMLRGDNSILTQHFCGVYGEKIRTVIRNVKQGEGKEEFNKLVNEGIIPQKYYLTSGYKNTYARLKENEPSTTITNNMATPSGLRCIHYEQNRALTPREGARIQSFPDCFVFKGDRVNVTKQIGNAVPPFLALQLAKQIEKTLGDTCDEK